MKIPTRKRPSNSRDWDPIHYQTENGEFTTGDKTKDSIIKEVVEYMQKNDPKGYFLQIAEDIPTGDLILHVDGSVDTQWFIYNKLICQ